MNKWLERSLLIDITLVLAFLLLDYITWNPIAERLTNSPLMSERYYNTGGFFNVLTFQLRQSGMSDYGIVRNDFTQAWNLPLFVFISAIIANVVLVWQSGKEAKKD